ncbi:MAG TPA: hypothetical protein VKQ36_04755, partial [Ktedonobacterales bacterium]|nr:hypothetical protein [Ktedonobacterales bacterium]
MPVLTELLNKPIRVPGGEEVATLQDLVALVGEHSEAPASNASGGATTAIATSPVTDVYPLVVGLVARLKTPRGTRQVFIPWDKVASLDTSGAQLRSPAVNLRAFERRPGELVLREGLFDRQVVDVEGRRVVRINDLDLALVDGAYRLVGVDVGPGAILRRLVGPRLGERVSLLVRREVGTRAQLIDWAQVAPVTDASNGGALRLRAPRERLALMEPADLARVVEQLTPQEGAALLGELDEAHAADTLEELEDEQQGQLLRAMDPERAADVLEEMEPDEATDALQSVQSVSSEAAADLLGRMNREDAEEVQELLGYPDDSAGGIMTTEYVSVPTWATVGAVIATMRAQTQAAAADLDDPLPNELPEIYVVEEDTPPARVAAPVKRNATRPRAPGAGVASEIADIEARAHRDAKDTHAAEFTPTQPLSLWTEGRLVGVVSLRDLLLAYPAQTLEQIMRPVESMAH